MIKWIKLNKYDGNNIMNEIDNVIEKYIYIFKEIKENNINKEKIKLFNDLRESIKFRINELNNFYIKNINDDRIGIFEKAKIKLENTIDKYFINKSILNINNNNNLILLL